MRANRLAILVVGAAIIAGCGAGGSSAPPSTTTTTPTIGPPMPPAGDPLITATDLAKADLIQRIGVREADIEVLGAEAVTWPNGAIGCPEPGRMYTQALVDGYQVILVVEGRSYAYHAGSDGVPFLCESPSDGPLRP